MSYLSSIAVPISFMTMGHSLGECIFVIAPLCNSFFAASFFPCCFVSRSRFFVLLSPFGGAHSFSLSRVMRLDIHSLCLGSSPLGIKYAIFVHIACIIGHLPISTRSLHLSSFLDRSAFFLTTLFSRIDKVTELAHKIHRTIIVSIFAFTLRELFSISNSPNSPPCLDHLNRIHTSSKK